MKSKYLMIGAAVCAALFLFSGIMLWRQYADEKQSAEAFEQVAALVETEPAPTDTPQETELLPELTAFEKYRARCRSRTAILLAGSPSPARTLTIP